MGEGSRCLFETLEDMKISFIATVYNEEKTVGLLLESLAKQTRMVDEIVIVDGGSTDATVEMINDLRLKIKDFNGKFLILTKKGNRAVGRNEAVRNATGDIIVCSDAGCVLDRDWVKKITDPFGGAKVDVVAGYYAARPQSVFQKCLVPYVLVMPDRVDPENFLPATRSMAFTKKIWEKAGGFPEAYSHNEDYVFARKLKHAGANIVFVKEAIVYWQPRKNFKEAFVMFFRFAYGDAEAGIFRPKVSFLFARYILGALLVLSYFLFPSFLLLFSYLLLLIAYIAWAIYKNYRYVADWRAILILPILQVTADIAVILGTIWGIQHKQ